MALLLSYSSCHLQVENAIYWDDSKLFCERIAKKYIYEDSSCKNSFLFSVLKILK